MIDGADGLLSRDTGREKFSTTRGSLVPGDFGDALGDSGGLAGGGDRAPHLLPFAGGSTKSSKWMSSARMPLSSETGF